MFSDARKYYEKALEIDDKDVTAIQGIGFIHLFDSKFTDAFKCFSQSLKFSGSNINITHHVRTALFAKSAGYIDEAKRLSNIVLKKEPKKPEEVSAASLACIILSDYEKAFNILCKNGHQFSGIPFKEQANLTDEKMHNQNFNSLGDMTLCCDVENYTHDKSPIFFVAANEKYFKLFFENLYNSIWKFNPEQRIHLHLMLESTEIISVLKKHVSKRFSLSFEIYTPPDTTGFTVRRFYRMYHLELLSLFYWQILI